jgi:hypothetical protein
VADEERAQDWRFFRLIESVAALAGVKQRPAPEVLFPSLKQKETPNKENEESLEAQYAAARAMFAAVAKQPKIK